LLQNEKQAFLRWVTRKNKKTLTYNRRGQLAKLLLASKVLSWRNESLLSASCPYVASLHFISKFVQVPLNEKRF